MNLLALTQRLYRETGKSGDGPTTLVGAGKIVQRLVDALNDSWMALQQEPYNWRWMRANGSGPTTPGQTAHSPADLGIESFLRWRVPSNQYAVRAATTDSPTMLWPLRWLEPDVFRSRLVDVPVAAGPPAFWSVDASDNLLIGPPGDVVYNAHFDYVSGVTELAADEDTPGMPSRHHMILVWRALVDAGKDIASPEKVSRAMDRLSEMESNLIDDQGETITMGNLPLY